MHYIRQYTNFPDLDLELTPSDTLFTQKSAAKITAVNKHNRSQALVIQSQRGTPMKIAYADCFSGISGDMFLAALLDAGLPLEVLQDAIEKLDLPEKVELHLTETHKGALRAANLDVIVPHSHHHRLLSDILGILSGSRLSEQVKQ